MTGDCDPSKLSWYAVCQAKGGGPSGAPLILVSELAALVLDVILVATPEKRMIGRV